MIFDEKIENFTKPIYKRKCFVVYFYPSFTVDDFICDFIGLYQCVAEF